jgi:hypothetical protein
MECTDRPRLEVAANGLRENVSANAHLMEFELNTRSEPATVG